MSVFADLDDEALAAEIVSLAQRIRGRRDDPDVKRVAGEGRMTEYDNASPRELRRLHREATEELERRQGGGGGRAIGVRF
jgi:hypothetical protein